MIVDHLKNASTYFGLGMRFTKAFRYLLSTDFGSIDSGKHELEGEYLYALVQQYRTAEKKEYLEAHRRYADIHYMVDGAEAIEVGSIDDLQAGEYDPVTDYLPLQGIATFIPIRVGSFAIFFPQDAHMPGLMFDSPQPVKKVVVKVLLD
jgi:YhcH/YjgK/YiaL family protein